MILDSAVFPSSGGGGSTATIWVSGQTVAQDEWKISPADRELYQRITASGSGSTDPADDMTNYVARSYPRAVSVPVKQLPTTAGAVGSTYVNANTITPSSSVDVRTSVFSTTGRGIIKFIGFFHAQANSRARRFEIFVDGRSIYDTGLVSMDASTSYTPIGSSGGGFNGTNVNDSRMALPTGTVHYRRSVQIWSTKSTDADTGTQLVIGTILHPEM